MKIECPRCYGEIDLKEDEIYPIDENGYIVVQEGAETTVHVRGKDVKIKQVSLILIQGAG